MKERLIWMTEFLLHCILYKYLVKSFYSICRSTALFIRTNIRVLLVMSCSNLEGRIVHFGSGFISSVKVVFFPSCTYYMKSFIPNVYIPFHLLVCCIMKLKTYTKHRVNLQTFLFHRMVLLMVNKQMILLMER